MYLIARDTYSISPREGDDRRSHPGPLRKNVRICITQACTTPQIISKVIKVKAREGPKFLNTHARLVSARFLPHAVKIVGAKLYEM